MTRKSLLIAAFLAGARAFPLDIATDTTWSGTLRLTESVTVLNGVTLTIDAGARIEFPAGAVLRVEGRLLAEGTVTSPILFTRHDHDAGSGRWGKIRLADADGVNRLIFCQFHYGNGTVGGSEGNEGVVSMRASNVVLEDCRFPDTNGDCVNIWSGSTAVLRRCYLGPGGEGVHGDDSDIEEDACVFTYREGRYDASDIQAQGHTVWVHHCVFLGSNLDDGADFDNCNGTVEHCLFINYLGTEPGWEGRCGGTTMNEGSQPIVRNNIYINCRQGIIAKGDCRPQISNCTFYSCTNAVAAYEAGEPSPRQVGFPTVRNCIIWNTPGTIVVGTDSGTGADSFVDIDYCDVSSTETLHASDPRTSVGPHIFKADPRFADPGTSTTADFHLLSTAGRWDPAAGGGAGGWVIDALDSPAIDAGDPAAPYALEPAPNGNRLNLGAYGNTAEASKSTSTAVLFVLQVDVVPTSGGMVTKTPDKPSYSPGETVQLQAVPAEGYRFDHWEGGATGTTPTVSVRMDANTSVTAVFEEKSTVVRNWRRY